VFRRRRGDSRPGDEALRSRRLELAAPRRKNAVDGLDTGARVHQIALGQLFGIDDGVSAGTGITGERDDAGELGSMDADLFRVQRDPVHWVARSFVRAPVFACVVRLSE